MLSYGYWKTRFAGDPNVLGKKMVLNGYPITIVGVSRAGFDGVEPGYSPQIRVSHDDEARARRRVSTRSTIGAAASCRSSAASSRG